MASKAEIQEAVREVVADEVQKLAIGPYQGHPGVLVGVANLTTEVTKERSLRKLAEINHNRVEAIYHSLFTEDGKLKAVLARFLD